MAHQTAVKRPESPGKRIARLLVITIIGVGLIGIAAYYQEDIHRYIRLRAWDKDAPGRVVVAFLNAAKQGNAEEADRYIGSPDYHPLRERDKVVGYFVTSPAGTMDFRFDDLVPEEIRVLTTRFVLVAEGAAEVEVPAKGGGVARYRLKMFNGQWKITDILDGGKRRDGQSQPSGGTPPG
ncbi:MAG: hypothetical protein NZT92_20600 [Abditibacteriales bacterium]|nr:hypothetical protein [Abditibacteriales bacterium]